MTDLRKAAEMALEALTCSDENDDPGHRCSHCDDYVDRNGSVRNALRAALEQEKKWDLIREMHNVEDKP